MSAQKRLNLELNKYAEDPQDGIIINADINDIYKWTVLLSGLGNSPYEGGVFELLINFPTDYPFKQPKYKFVTRIYHHNVSSKDGQISFPGICPDCG